MAGKSFEVVPSSPARGDAEAPRVGAAQPPLGLSLGHFGTTEEERDDEHIVDVLSRGHLRVVVDYDQLTVMLLQDRSKSVSREARRRTERKVQKLLLTLRREGFNLVQGGAV